MYSLSRMYSLRQLDLSFNGITTIEGLRELVHLEWLSLSGNNIKVCPRAQCKG
jgi:centrosomal protein CEP97